MQDDDDKLRNQQTPEQSDVQQSSSGRVKDRAAINLSGGRYELEEFVSKGGMGIVYRAKDAELGRDVAVKFLLDVTRDDAKKNALVEARTLAAMNHPNIMKIYDVVTSDEQVWIVTEWLQGQSLSEQKLPLPTTITLAIMAQVYDALDAAHNAGVIHRDIKPSNVMINADGRVILIDFGVAFAPGVSTGQTMVGSMRYTDPRILEGMPPDSQSDLFAAGLMQLQLMTGQYVVPDIAPLPLYRFMRKNLVGRVNQMCETTYPPLADLARRIIMPSSGSNQKGFSAKQAATEAKKLLLKLTGSSPQEYLAKTICSGNFVDHNAEILMIKEVNQAIRSKNLSPKQKAAWLAYYSVFENGDENFLSEFESSQRSPFKARRFPFFRIATLALITAFSVFLTEKELQITHQFFGDEEPLTLPDPEKPAMDAGVSEQNLATNVAPDKEPSLTGPDPEPLSSEPEANFGKAPQPDVKTVAAPKGPPVEEKQLAKIPAPKKSEPVQVEKSPDLALEPFEPIDKTMPFAPTESSASDVQTLERAPEDSPVVKETEIIDNSIVNNQPSVSTATTSQPETIAIYMEANLASDIYIDDQYFGRLPNDEPFSFKPGKYKVRLENAYSKPLATTIEVKSGEPLKYKFRLVPMTTRRTIVLKKPAHLFINGTDYGVVEEQTINVPFGELDIWIKRDDEIKNPKIAISPGGPERLSLE